MKVTKQYQSVDYNKYYVFQLSIPVLVTEMAKDVTKVFYLAFAH